MTLVIQLGMVVNILCSMNSYYNVVSTRVKVKGVTVLIDSFVKTKMFFSSKNNAFYLKKEIGVDC